MQSVASQSSMRCRKLHTVYVYPFTALLNLQQSIFFNFFFGSGRSSVSKKHNKTNKKTPLEKAWCTCQQRALPNLCRCYFSHGNHMPLNVGRWPHEHIVVLLLLFPRECLCKQSLAHSKLPKVE